MTSLPEKTILVPDQIVAHVSELIDRAEAARSARADQAQTYWYRHSHEYCRNEAQSAERAIILQAGFCELADFLIIEPYRLAIQELAPSLEVQQAIVDMLPSEQRLPAARLLHETNVCDEAVADDLQRAGVKLGELRALLQVELVDA